ncbi:hypothetical protein VNO77_11172 [Canavalia gladiata]|uniref:Uncharacterized protein n=1 Tax=Canavalia gladiata TaxID=3824 RepID=A0AAN9QXJ6_CANGL
MFCILFLFCNNAVFEVEFICMKGELPMQSSTILLPTKGGSKASNVMKRKYRSLRTRSLARVLQNAPENDIIRLIMVQFEFLSPCGLFSL